MITIREAQKDDAGQIAPLINIIFKEMELEELEDVSDPAVLKAITAAYQSEAYLSGVATTVVAEADGQVVGVAFGYPDENEDVVDHVLEAATKFSDEFADDPFGSDYEAFENEWYLDSIVVDPEYQGMGIGGQLLDAIPACARADNKRVIGLNVDFDNPGAKALYHRHGFETVGTTQIGYHWYAHMQRSSASRESVRV
ncbi:GNAT family N-acetyltransferase [Furfurilactobacillus entadae]|uniref:GNAT family N-acetyltransferase n=1 Tax=Furfurilactobacillus entadae TaxID=2922307 RepID=UPI0038B29A2D